MTRSNQLNWIESMHSGEIILDRHSFKALSEVRVILSIRDHKYIITTTTRFTSFIKFSRFAGLIWNIGFTISHGSLGSFGSLGSPVLLFSIVLLGLLGLLVSLVSLGSLVSYMSVHVQCPRSKTPLFIKESSKLSQHHLHKELKLILRIHILLCCSRVSLKKEDFLTDFEYLSLSLYSEGEKWLL